MAILSHLASRWDRFIARRARGLGFGSNKVLAERVAELELVVSQFGADHRIAVRDTRSSLEEIEQSLSEQVESVRTSEMLLGHGVRFFDRSLSEREARLVVEEVEEITGSSATGAMIQAYRYLIWSEAGSFGRVAGSTSNILGKLVMCRLLAKPGARVLEIGTLYGVFAGCVYHELARSGVPPTMTLVDPLAGLQVQTGKSDQSDPTGTPVTESIVRQNLALAGVPLSRARVVRGLSTDTAVRHQVATQTYDLVIVDGDHSESGVSSDLAWAVSISSPNALIVVDDYGDPLWPGVSAATDRFLQESRRCVLVGRVSTSALLRVDG